MKIEVHKQGGTRKVIDIEEGATKGARIGVNVWNQDGSLFVPAEDGVPTDEFPITYWSLIQEIPLNVVALAETTTTGIYAITGIGTSETRTIQPVAGETTVSDGDGVSGDPTIGLADLADSGGGEIRKFDRDEKGRVSGTSTATTDDLPEGAANLYFTAQRVRDVVLTGLSLASDADITAVDTALVAFGKLQAQITALTSSIGDIITQTITDGDTTHAPSGDAVFDALALKFDKTGGAISGSTTVTGIVTATGPSARQAFIDRTTAQSWGWYGTGGVAHLYNGTSSILNVDNSGNVRPSGDLVINKNSPGIYLNSPAEINGWRFVASVSDAANFGFQVRTQDNAVHYRFDTTSFAPDPDNSKTCGTASRRWSVFYGATGSINTSDAREKTTPRRMTDAECAAALEIAQLPNVFKFLNSVQEKGYDSARLHCSPTVQAVIAVMESHGLDPFSWGFVCYDAWPELPEIVESWEAEPAEIEEWPDLFDAEGMLVKPAGSRIIKPAREAGSQIVQEHRPAGDRYSLRPDELRCFVQTAIVRKLLEGAN